MRWFRDTEGGRKTTEIHLEELARDELAEETGLRAERTTHPINLRTAYGAIQQIHYVYLGEAGNLR